MIITSIILSGLALALSVWMGRRNPVRASGLTAGMLVLLMLTPALLWLPKVHMEVNVPWASAEVATVAGSDLSHSTPSTWSFMYGLLWVYGGACAVLFARLLTQYRVMKRWCDDSVLDIDEGHLELLESCGEQLSLTQLPELSFSEQVCSPVVTGLLRPKLLLPTSALDWSHETLKMVMLHELGHVQRRDLWTNLAGQVACALHWFNPLVWILRKRLTNECEYACDAHVISCGAPARTYVNALCDVAQSCQEQMTARTALNSKNGYSLGFSAVLSMASEASLKSRVQNLLEDKPGVDRMNSIIVMSILAVSASSALAINLVRPDVKPEMNTTEVKLIEEQLIPDEAEVEMRLSASPFPGG